LIVVMLNVIMLIVYADADCSYAEGGYTECHYAECC
jgi:hypothetical protein